MLCQTQWRFAFGGGPTGLDYAGVRVVAELREIDLTPDLFSDLQVIEQEFVRLVQKKASHG